MPFISQRPLTEARLASALEVKLMTPVVINIGKSLQVEFPQGLTLGTISNFSRMQTRDVTKRYTLGRHAFEPYDIIPGRVDTKLRLEKVVLYSEYLVQKSDPSMQAFLTAYSAIGQFAAGSSPLTSAVAGLTTAAVTGDQVHLSEGDLMGILGYVSGNLFFQQSPFALQEIIHAPDGSDKESTIVSYYDCWMVSNPIEYDIQDRGQLIIQECEVEVGRVTTSIPLDKAASPLVRKLLPSAIKL